METLRKLINFGFDVAEDYGYNKELNSKNWGILQGTTIKLTKSLFRKAGDLPVNITQSLFNSCKVLPWPGLEIERTTIPGRFREKANLIMKKYFEEKYGKYPLPIEYHWNTSKPLEIQWLNPKNRTIPDQQSSLYFVHGGAWVFGHNCLYNHAFRDLTEASNSNIMAIDYRLTPQVPLLSQLEDVVAGYFYLIAPSSERGAGKKNYQIVTGGESAGAHLNTALLHFLRNTNSPSPAGTYLISPVLDLTFSQPSFLTNSKRDVLFDNTDQPRLDSEGLHIYSNLNDIIYGQSPPFALKRIKEDGSIFGPKEILLWPELSPLFDKNMENLPPSIIIAGERDSLRDTSVLYGKLRAEAELKSTNKTTIIPNIQTYIFEDMVHAFPVLPPNKYSKKALKTMGEFIYQALNANNKVALESKKYKYLPDYKKAYMESTYNMYWNSIQNEYSTWNSTYQVVPFPTAANLTQPGILPNLPQSYSNDSYLKA